MMVSLADTVEHLLKLRPGRSAHELSFAIYGDTSHVHEITAIIDTLVKQRGLPLPERENSTDRNRWFDVRQRWNRRAEDLKAHATSLLSQFQEIRPDLRISHARVFVEVAFQEGLSISEYARRLVIAEAVAREQLRDLSRTHGKTAAFPALVQIDGNPGHGEIAKCYLSSAACSMLAKNLDAIEAA